MPQDPEGGYGQLFKLIRDRYCASEEDRLARIERSLDLSYDLVSREYAYNSAEDTVDSGNDVMTASCQTRDTIHALHSSLKSRKDENAVQKKLFELFIANNGPWLKHNNMAFMSTADSPIKIMAGAFRADKNSVLNCRIAFHEKRYPCCAHGPTLDYRF